MMLLTACRRCCNHGARHSPLSLLDEIQFDGFSLLWWSLWCVLLPGTLILLLSIMVCNSLWNSEIELISLSTIETRASCWAHS